MYDPITEVPSGLRFLQTLSLCNIHITASIRMYKLSSLIQGMSVRICDGVFRDVQCCFVNLRELQLFMYGGTFCNPYHITMFLKMIILN